MSAQNSAGIQTLLDAEREAQKIVQKAREYRTKRVKDARSEAQKEIEEYRNQKEEEFKKFESEQTGGNKKAEEDANRDTEAKLKDIKAAGSKSGDKVVEELLKIVTEVKPEVPQRVAAQS
ncbi:MAG: hypothetical protein GOMPHAMPRED_002008 [Gomphillus americanus]|uniref:V-type proton ATPase subunit G n=1 Tax=Gomphillus americanus TaxID=1940652 RepID=A0A8H3FAU0_9LECA|nr:MAG: hypothetical protein GOMPHAMPRED_002008 [Gomphillus americanus]